MEDLGKEKVEYLNKMGTYSIIKYKGQVSKVSSNNTTYTTRIMHTLALFPSHFKWKVSENCTVLQPLFCIDHEIKLLLHVYITAYCPTNSTEECKKMQTMSKCS